MGIMGHAEDVGEYVSGIDVFDLINRGKRSPIHVLDIRLPLALH